jgi:hypothetical protein
MIYFKPFYGDYIEMFIFPKIPKLWILQLGKALISSYEVQSYNPWQNILNSMLHTSIESHLTCMTWVWVVINQTTNLTFSFFIAIIYISQFQMENLNALLISTFWKNFNNIYMLNLTRFITYIFIPNIWNIWALLGSSVHLCFPLFL